ncbi:MAG: 2OG-Fe(II) oxygenase family protein [Pseudomonadota bacterium]
MDPLKELPLVDLSTVRDQAALAALLKRTFHRSGFCYLAGHGVPRALIDGVLAANRRFHAQPLAAKEAVAINAAHRGYMGFASSLIVTSSVERARKPNQSESFMMMHELAPDDPELRAGRPLQGPNRWPEALPGFRAAVVAYNDALEALARRLMGAVGVAFGADLTRHFEKPTTFLRLLHYPPPEDPLEPGLYGSAPHTDYGFLTILLQDETGGLQVLNEEEQWIDAPPRPGCFVVNIGDMAMRWSNGHWRSTRHRVINSAGRDRYSVPFFFDPDMDTVVAPLDPGQAPRFEALRYGDYLMERIDANYAYRKETVG